MLGRFLGERGRRLRVEALASQKTTYGWQSRIRARVIGGSCRGFLGAGWRNFDHSGRRRQRHLFCPLGNVRCERQRTQNRGARSQRACGRDGRNSTGSEKIGQCRCREGSDSCTAYGGGVHGPWQSISSDISVHRAGIGRSAATEKCFSRLFEGEDSNPYRVLNRSFAYSPCCSKRVYERPLHRSRLDGRSLPRHELPPRNLGGAN